MRLLLIAANLILGLILAASFLPWERTHRQSKFTVVKKTSAKNTKVSTGSSGTLVPKGNFPSLEESIALIPAKNIFNRERCASATVAGARNARVELGLVGTFRIGQIEGAIITQKTSGARRGGFMMGMWGPPDGAAPQGSFNGPPQPNPGQGGTPGAPPGGGFPGRGNNGSLNVRTNTAKNATATQNTLAIKQYVRVGETLSNGYKLISVTRSEAVLTKGSEKITLPMLDPSNAASTAASGNPRRNTNPIQQLQDMQRMQMMQNMQMMRMMRSSMQQSPRQDSGRGGAQRSNTRR
ncbi:MAG: hypothetical protein PHS41_04020 [Victivallaceae bacterium]|nr:hypothetical protein [Victivallaceae bacterium]